MTHEVFCVNMSMFLWEGEGSFSYPIVYLPWRHFSHINYCEKKMNNGSEGDVDELLSDQDAKSSFLGLCLESHS